MTWSESKWLPNTEVLIALRSKEPNFTKFEQGWYANSDWPNVFSRQRYAMTWTWGVHMVRTIHRYLYKLLYVLWFNKSKGRHQFGCVCVKERWETRRQRERRGEGGERETRRQKDRGRVRGMQTDRHRSIGWIGRERSRKREIFFVCVCVRERETMIGKEGEPGERENEKEYAY